MTFRAKIYAQINKEKENIMNGTRPTKADSSTGKEENKSDELACKLTAPELQGRKETVLKSLRTKIIERRVLENGYAFKFPGTGEMFDELAEFIKTEQECCGFFTFSLSTSGDKSGTWLELTGPEGSKDFIRAELGL